MHSHHIFYLRNDDNGVRRPVSGPNVSSYFDYWQLRDITILCLLKLSSDSVSLTINKMANVMRVLAIEIKESSAV